MKINGKKDTPVPRRRGRMWLGGIAMLLILGAAVGGTMLQRHVTLLDRLVQQRFDGRRWAVPAQVYARPLELYRGLALSADGLEEELALADYRRTVGDALPGGFVRHGETVHLVTRPFVFADGPQESMDVSVYFAGGTVAGCYRTLTGEPLSLVRLDPARIASFLPQNGEDRLLLQREDLPEQFVQTLLAVEDRSFYVHHGIDPRGILRAARTNLLAWARVEGGSTLTQQLVKNFFLSSERTFKRKLNEMIMAVLLERRFDKDEILTAYANEIFLGQDGARAVHGFGLASRYYFQTDLADLNAAQIALLVGMVKGPVRYNPRVHRERALQRRRTVLDRMLAGGIIDRTEHEAMAAAPLLIVPARQGGFNRYPAFLDLVRRQLRDQYRPEDITDAGLTVLTTLDPRLQHHVERELGAGLERIEREGGLDGLEGAVVCTNRNSGEVLAVAGGKHYRTGMFNRALDARRPIGSLVKPAVYLAALEQGYELDSPLLDAGLSVATAGGGTWTPANYDRREHGRVMLWEALAHSYNLATVRLGLDLGLEKVTRTLGLLGVEGEIPPYPSTLLGSLELSPVMVSRMYQTLAAGGFYQPQYAISAVLAPDRRVLERYELTVEQRFSPEAAFRAQYALQLAVRSGTGAGLKQYLPVGHGAAGKTGTSDSLRDSWFAGYVGDWLGVVWVGRDDNRPAGLTGSSGALQVWGAIMAAAGAAPLSLLPPPGIVWKDTGIDQAGTGLRLPLAGAGHEAGRYPGEGAPHDGVSVNGAQKGDRAGKQPSSGPRAALEALLDLFR